MYNVATDYCRYKKCLNLATTGDIFLIDLLIMNDYSIDNNNKNNYIIIIIINNNNNTFLIFSTRGKILAVRVVLRVLKVNRSVFVLTGQGYSFAFLVKSS